MINRYVALTSASMLGLLVLATSLVARPQTYDGKSQNAQTAPGAGSNTVPDRFPAGCVGCHVKLPNVDGRLSVMMKQWAAGVPEPLLARLQAAAPKGVTLKGKHPDVTFAYKDIPKSCVTCHSPGSKIAPPFSAMIHLIHLTGGEQNHYLAEFKGECTTCHKLNPVTGIWKAPSGPET